jgi:Ca-activated chloride channel family protein
MTKTKPGEDMVRIRARWDKAAVAIGKGETHLVVTIETPKVKRAAGRAPVDVTFVIDRSGSMSGEPLELAKRAVREALDLLDERDSFAVVAYDNLVYDVVPFGSATKARRRDAAGLIRAMETGGSTNLFGGWHRGSEHLLEARRESCRRSGHIRRAILLTDGLANVGETNAAAISWHVTRARQQGIVTSTLGMGHQFDEMLLTGMAEAGGGNYAFASRPRDLPAFFARELGEALTVLATGASLTLTLPKGMRATLLNPFPIDRSGKTITVALGDLPAGMTLNLVFAVTTRAKAAVVYPGFNLTGQWTGTGEAAPIDGSITIAIDPLMAMTDADFAAMPFDDEAGRIATEMVAAHAKREALRAYRAGDATTAHASLHAAQLRFMAAPASAILSEELAELDTLDFASPSSEPRRRQIMNDAHRQARGRER